MGLYAFYQNNSGGEYSKNPALAPTLIIEAATESEAENKAFALGVYYNGVRDGRDCSCCGDRWTSPYELSVEDLEDTCQYGGWRIYRADGTVESKGVP